MERPFANLCSFHRPGAGLVFCWELQASRSWNSGCLLHYPGVSLLLSSFGLQGIISFHPSQDSSLERVYIRSLGLVFRCEIWCRCVWPDKLSRSLTRVAPCITSMLSSASRHRGGSWTFGSWKKKVNLSRCSIGYCSQLSGGNRPGIMPSN